MVDLARRLSDRTFLAPTAALAAATAALFAGVGFLPMPALLPDLAGLLIAAVVVGLGTAVITAVAFAALAAGSPPERLGQTMGAAEIGRELGDAGGPLLVGALAASIGLAAGFVGIAALVALVAVAITAASLSPRPHPSL